jgi:hypothetical protein
MCFLKILIVIKIVKKSNKQTNKKPMTKGKEERSKNK